MYPFRLAPDGAHEETDSSCGTILARFPRLRVTTGYPRGILGKDPKLTVFEKPQILNQISGLLQKKKFLVNPNVTTKNEEVLERKERRISKGIFLLLLLFLFTCLLTLLFWGEVFQGYMEISRIRTHVVKLPKNQ